MQLYLIVPKNYILFLYFTIFSTPSYFPTFNKLNRPHKKSIGETLLFNFQVLFHLRNIESCRIISIIPIQTLEFIFWFNPYSAALLLYMSFSL
jgi:hypothetical protein